MEKNYNLKELIAVSDKRKQITEEIREELENEFKEAEKFIELISFLIKREGIFSLIWSIEAIANELRHNAEDSDELDAHKHTVFAVVGALPFETDELMDAVKKLKKIEE